MNQYIPAFEGRAVDGTSVKMSGAAPLDDLSEVVLGVDDMVQMTTMFRCVGVFHRVEEKTGKLIRVHTLRPVEMALQPLDPDNPADDGIIRALPTYGQRAAITAGGDDE